MCGLTAVARADRTDPMDILRDLVYATPDGISLKLDLYIPKNLPKPPPIILWVHGGGWEAGNKETPPVLAVTRVGFALASIDYRLSQQAIFPAQIFDCKAAVRWLRAHAADYHLDGGRIGAMGASAGGHLVALLGTTAGDAQLEGAEGVTGVSSAVQAVVDYFGPTDLLDIGRDANWKQDIKNPVSALLGGSVASKSDDARLASPVFHVTSQACPFFIVQGDQDPIVPYTQSVELNDALTKAGVASQLILVKGGGHGFDDPASFAGAIAFLQKHLQAP